MRGGRRKTGVKETGGTGIRFPLLGFCLTGLLVSVGAGRCGSSTGWGSTGAFDARGCTGLNGATDDSWYTASHGDANLSWNALCAGHVAGFTNLAADRVGDFASAGLLLHPADGVRHLLRACFRHHPAGGVGHFAGDAFFDPVAGCVGNLAGARLLLHVADSVWNLLLAGFCHE